MYFPEIDELQHDKNYQWYEKSNGKIEGESGQWDDYTEYYFDNAIANDIKYDMFGKNPIEYNTYIENDNNLSNYDTYSIRNGKVVYNADPKDDMAYQYPIIKNDNLGFYVIKDTIYKPFNAEYIDYNGNYVFVYEIDNFVQLNMKYCYIKGQKIYSKTREDGESYYFKIDNKEYDVKPSSIFVSYNGNAYKVTDNSINVNGVKYPKIESYCVINGKNYYISNNTIISLKRVDDSYTIDTSLIKDLGDKISDFDNNSSGYTIENDIVFVLKPYNEYSFTELSGYTESKLSSFETFNQAYDDMGNKLPGCLLKDSNGYTQPTEGSYLDLPYKVGNVSDLTLINDENKEWFGNILTSITFYYVDYYGNIIDGTEEKCEYGSSLLDAITKLTSKEKVDEIKSNLDIKKHYSLDEVLRCKLQYHMGAIITQDNEKYKLKSEDKEYGVRYEEEVKLIDKTFEYMFNEVSSFIIKYYMFEYNETFDKLDEYSNEYVKVGKSYFSYKIDDIISSGENGYRAKYDGMIAAPVFREEYKFGSSSLEKIDANIYIDRGFSSSFERHLKLLDVKSMEALENLGNGFYNIIEN